MYDAQLAFSSSAYNECNQQNNSKLDQEQSEKVNEDNANEAVNNDCTPNSTESTLYGKTIINNEQLARQEGDSDVNSESDDSGDWI